jgi:hypothetical protein
MSFDEFVAFFKKYGRFPRGNFSGKRLPNDRELKTRYERYARSEAYSVTYREEKYHLEEATPDGPRRCSLLVLLDNEDEKILRENAGQLLYTLDRAHVFGKNAYPHMRYLSENVIWLNRWSHRCMDSQQNPVTGKSLDKDGLESWWHLLVGDERYDSLLELSRQKH